MREMWLWRLAPGLLLLPSLLLGQQWERIVGRLEAAEPVAVVQSPRTGQLWLVANRALYRAAALGSPWERLSSLPFASGTPVLAGEGTTEVLLVPTPYGLWRTTDGGTTWTQVHPVLSDRATRLWVHPLAPNVVVGMRGQAAWRSTDAGATWDPIPAPEGTLAAMCPFGTLQELLAFTSRGVFRSTDGGISWEALQADLPNERILSLAVVAGVPPQLIALLPSGAYMSADGVSWRAISTATAPPQMLFTFGGLVAAVAPDAILLLRADATWQAVYSGATDHISAVLPVAGDRMLVLSELQGVELYRWQPQPQWQRLMAGLDDPRILHLLPAPDGLIVGSPGAIFWSSSDATVVDNLTREGFPRPAAITAVAAYTGGLYAATRFGLYRYDRAQGRWQTVTEALPALDEVIALSCSLDGDTVLALSGAGELLLSTDAGRSWQNVEHSYRLSGVLVAPTGELFAFGTDGVLRSRDGGNTWQPVAGYPSAKGCYALAIHPRQPRSMLASAVLPGSRTGVLLRSTDGGESWQQIAPAEVLNAGVLSVAPATQAGTWVVGTLEGEVFLTTDDGGSWRSLGGPDRLPVPALAQVGEWVFAGTERGLWRARLSVDVPTSQPQELLVELQGRELRVRLAAESSGVLLVWDVLGRVVARYAVMPGVEQRIVLPSLPAGVYALALYAGQRRHLSWIALP
jgi:photosystem II stability/assembly factor-like uncharacterized protein